MSNVEVKCRSNLVGTVKKKGLTSYTLHIIEKNKSLENLKNKLEIMIKDDKRDKKKQLQQYLENGESLTGFVQSL
jgi:hypothetical protein